MTKISTYRFVLRGGITAEPGKNTYDVPYKPGDQASDFGGGGAMLLVNGGRLVLREDTDTFQLAFGASSFTLTWRDLLHTVGDTDDISVTTDIFNTFVGLGIAGSTPGGPAGGDLTGLYPNPNLIAKGPGALTFGDATHIPQFTLDANGRVVGVTPVLVVAPATGVPGGPAGGDLAGTYPDPTLKVLGSGGTAGSATMVSQVTVDTKGRVIALADVPISGVSGPPTGPATGDLTGTYPNPSIAPGAVSNAKLAAMGAAMLKGRPVGAGSGDPQDLNQSAVVAILDTASVTLTKPFTASTITAGGAINGGSLNISGGAVVGPATGGNLGAGTVNVSTGYYLNGVPFVSGGGGAVSNVATKTNVPAAVASTQLLATNANRVGASIYNDSPAELYVNLGSAAAPTAMTVDMLPGSYYEVPFGFTGAIFGIWAAAIGNARMTEFTP